MLCLMAPGESPRGQRRKLWSIMSSTCRKAVGRREREKGGRGGKREKKRKGEERGEREGERKKRREGERRNTQREERE